MTPSFSVRPDLVSGARSLWGGDYTLDQLCAAAGDGSFRAFSVLLHLLYGSPPVGNQQDDPLGGLVLLVCSPRARESAYLSAWAKLRAARGNRPWASLVESPEGVARAVQGLPFARRTAGLLLELLATPDLEGELHHIVGLAPADALAALRALPGVGEKVGRCFLLYHGGMDLVPVDVHTARVSTRLGLAQVYCDRKGVTRHAGRELDACCPPGHAYAWHVNTMEHGRRFCGSVPRCDACPLRGACPSGAS
jgi:endonuclease III